MNMKSSDIAPNTPYKWKCPYCHHACTVSEHDEVRSIVREEKDSENSRKPSKILFVRFIKCPNDDCNKTTLTCSLNEEISENKIIGGTPEPIIVRPSPKKCWTYEEDFSNDFGDTCTCTLHLQFIQSWTLVPPSSAQCFPDYVPKSIREDYEEACLIKQYSPKAAATLARRCIQSILCNFYKAKDSTIAKQIQSVRKKPDASRALLENFDMIRKYGNIGSHSPNDINLIVDIQEGEADVLLQFIENAIEQTYVRKKQDEDAQEKLKNARKPKAARKNEPRQLPKEP